MPKQELGFLTSVAHMRTIQTNRCPGVRGARGFAIAPLAVVLLVAPGARPSHPPVDRIQLFGFLAGDVEEKYLVRMISERGIDFEPTSDRLGLLRDAGAGSLLLESVAKAHRVRPPSSARDDPGVEAALARLEEGARLTYQGDSEGAERAFKAALDIEPQVAALHLALGNVLPASSRLQEKVAQFEDAVRLQPDEAELHQKLAVVYDDYQKDPERALAELRIAVSLEPDYSERHYNLATHLLEAGRLDESVVENRKALELDPNQRDAHVNIAAALFREADLDGAIAEDREEIRINPDSALARANLGNELVLKGELDEAIVEEREALRLEPDYWRAHVFLAGALFSKGERLGALREISKIKAVRLLEVSVVAFFALLIIAVVMTMRRRRRSAGAR